MATKKETPADKPVKKKTYKKPTADKMADRDLAGVTGGADKAIGGCAGVGGAAATPCGVGGAAAFTCAPTGGAAAWGCKKGSKP